MEFTNDEAQLDLARAGGQEQGVLRLNELAPFMALEPTPTALAEAVEGLAVDPVVQFHMAGATGSALEFGLHGKDLSILRASCANDGVEPQSFAVSAGAVTWLRRKTLTHEGSDGTMIKTDSEAIEGECRLSEYAPLRAALTSYGFYVFATEEDTRHYNMYYDVGACDVHAVCKALYEEAGFAPACARLVEERGARGIVRKVYVCADHSEVLPDLKVVTRLITRSFPAKTVQAQHALHSELERAVWGLADEQPHGRQPHGCYVSVCAGPFWDG